MLGIYSVNFPSFLQYFPFHRHLETSFIFQNDSTLWCKIQYLDSSKFSKYILKKNFSKETGGRSDIRYKVGVASMVVKMREVRLRQFEHEKWRSADVPAQSSTRIWSVQRLHRSKGKKWSSTASKKYSNGIIYLLSWSDRQWSYKNRFNGITA